MRRAARLVLAIAAMISASALADSLDDQMMTCKQHMSGVFVDGHIQRGYASGFEVCYQVETDIVARNAALSATSAASDLQRLKSLRGQP